MRLQYTQVEMTIWGRKMWDSSSPFGVSDQIRLWLGLYSIFFGKGWRSENALQREHHLHSFFLWLNCLGIKSNKNSFNQFWRDGDYGVQNEQKWSLPGGMYHVQVHPKFLHSNVTSHNWEFGDISKLLDNAQSNETYHDFLFFLYYSLYLTCTKILINPLT